MIVPILLLVLLFLSGLLTTYFRYSPSKKLTSWLQSFSLKLTPSSSTTTPDTTSTHEKSTSSRIVSYEEKGTTVSKRAELKGVFATFDKNGDGFITKQELRESLKNIGVSMSEKEVQEIVVKVDSNGDGLIDFEEFSNLCEAMWGAAHDQDSNYSKESGKLEVVGKGGGGGGDQEGELKEAFDVFDKDRDGLISVEELGSVLCSLGLKQGGKLEDCKEMIRKVDMDGDGMVSFDEFKMMMRMKSGGGGGNKLISVL